MSVLNLSLLLIAQLTLVVSYTLTSQDISNIQATIASTLKLTPQYGLKCNHNIVSCPASDLFGSMVRLAFHDASGQGGPNGNITLLA